MENASKALIMAGTMLIGVLLLSLMAYLFSQGSNFNKEYNKTMSDREIQAFNAQFEKYLDKNMTGDDVVSLLKLAIDHNKKMEYSAGDVIEIEVKVNKIKPPNSIQKTGKEDRDIEVEGVINQFLESYSRNTITEETDAFGNKTYKQIFFERKTIEYNETTGKISKIQLEEKEVEIES